MRSLIPLSLVLTIFDSPVYAAIFPVQINVRSPATSSSSLRRRGADTVPISNTGNAQYVSNITLGGVTLPVLLDTGSSDLWVNFPNTVPTAMNNTGKSVSLSYAVGKAAGNIQTTTAQLGGVTVTEQAFLWVNDTSTFTSDIHDQGYDGLLGLGPNTGSAIRKKVDNDAGDSFLQRAFDQDHSTDNYITILLNRQGDPSENFTGQFSVGEVISGYENITNMPTLDVDTVNRILKADQHWQALTDANNGVIGPDGQPIQIKSIVPSAPKGVYVAVIDSGFTFSQVPRDMSDAIYGRVQGAYYDDKNQWWLVPCGQYLNISFNFGGINYPVHPLDTVDNNFGITDSTGRPVCIGAFQPITSAFSLLGHYDMILGMSFLRNAYTLLNFGNWIDGTSSQDHPYIQMAPVTDPAAALDAFVQVRLNGNNTISNPMWSLLPANETQHSPVSEEEKKEQYQEMILSRWPYILTGCFAFFLILLGLCIWKCCCRKKGKNGTSGKKSFFSRKAKQGRQSYLNLESQNAHKLNTSTANLNDVNPRSSSPYEHNLSGYSNNQFYASDASLHAPAYEPSSPTSSYHSAGYQVSQHYSAAPEHQTHSQYADYNASSGYGYPAQHRGI